MKKIKKQTKKKLIELKILLREGLGGNNCQSFYKNLELKHDFKSRFRLKSFKKNDFDWC
jgi:hypothetical protein